MRARTRLHALLRPRSPLTGPLSQTAAVLTSGLERIPDQLGYLVISEDGVLAVSVRVLLADRILPVRPAASLLVSPPIDQLLAGCARPRPPPSHLWFSLQVSWRTTSTPRLC